MGKGKWVVYVIGAVIMILSLLPLIFYLTGVWE